MIRLCSALFPFLIGKITSPPSPPVAKRDVSMPKVMAGRDESAKANNPSPLDGFMGMFKK